MLITFYISIIMYLYTYSYTQKHGSHKKWYVQDLFCLQGYTKEFTEYFCM